MNNCIQTEGGVHCNIQLYPLGPLSFSCLDNGKECNKNVPNCNGLKINNKKNQ